MSGLAGRTSFDARAVARVDTSAVADNCRRLKRELEDSLLCAVVKADGYGHGAVPCAVAALEGGAEWLAVVTAAEAAQLRAAGIDNRLLVMGALRDDSLRVALDADADVVVWRDDQVEAALAGSVARPPRLHVKLDTGMGRLGARDTDQALELVNRIASDARLELAGFMTHFATADDPSSDLFDQQLELFAQFAAKVKADHPECVVHAANSAALLRTEAARFDMARCGIAIYGLDPEQVDPRRHELRPALSLESYVADLKAIPAGEGVGYGRTWTATRDTTVAVLPIGYGDGYRRALSNRAQVLIGAHRFAVVGTVSMDSITVDVGSADVALGDAAILIGTSGGERLLAEELAREIGTINYEITCGLSPRVQRVYDRDLRGV